MPIRRPSPLTAALVVLLAVLGALGILAPGMGRAEASSTRTSPPEAAAARTTVGHGVTARQRAQLAVRADRSSRGATNVRPATDVRPKGPARSAAPDRREAPLLFGRSILSLELTRIEARQERIEAARKARERQQWLDRYVLPLHSFTWSAGFGEAGPMWSSGYHTGQDFAAPYGTPVYAAARGTITFAGWSGAYGNKIVITDYDGSQSWYGHMSRLARTSGTVRAGQLIGYVGCTGNCYGTHLHFEIHLPDGQAIDPVPWLRSHGAL